MSDELGRPKEISSPLTEDQVAQLSAGDRVELSGVVYTARDQAHARLAEMLDRGADLPFDVAGQTIYYAGPAPTPPGEAIGSIGPTTSKRMDPFTPRLLGAGVRAMIGKGDRSPAVYDAIKEFGAVYFVAVGGAAVLLAQFVSEAQVVAFEELGPEAIHRLTVSRLPLIVGIDSRGDSALWRPAEKPTGA